MNQDIIVNDKEGTYHHGKLSNRIYLMKLHALADYRFIKKLEELAICQGYTKFIAKVPVHKMEEFEDCGFKKEAAIPSFYNGMEDCIFMSKYYSHERSRVEERQKIESVIQMAKSKNNSKYLPAETFEIKILTPENIPEMAELYKKVFASYPFPIFDAAYLKSTMLNDVIYFGGFKNNKLAACASCETCPESENSEMTDFAVLDEHRGHHLASLLLKAMESKMRSLNYKTLYTIARSHSCGMNCTFGENGYQFGGTLYNNTQICGDIESMNVWYKLI